jgi:hypothetical protein
VKRFLVFLAAALVMTSMLVAMTAPAFAKITPPECETTSGQLPPGQQPECQGSGLEQQPAENPAGHAPPGQQP